VDYRRITAQDIDQVLAFAIEGLRPERVPLNFSRYRTEAIVRHFQTCESDFHLAAFDGERLVGLIAAAVADMPFFERGEAHVFVLYATVPGVGRVLIRRILEWFKASPRVQRLLWAQNPDADHRTHRYARWVGRQQGAIVQQSTMQVFYKGPTA
jgi:hypothetical protein